MGRRGSIMDSNRNELAASINAYSMYVNPSEIENIEIILKKIDEIIDIDYEELKNLYERNRNSSFLWFVRGLQLHEYRRIDDMKLEGVDFRREFKRIYTENNLGANLIGMVGVDDNDFYDNKGLEGIENYFDNYLKGQKVFIEMMMDNHGHSFYGDNPESVYNEYNGADVILTIDKIIQYWAEEELNNTIEENDAKKGHIIVMDTNTFEVLAVANYPTYSATDFQNTPSEHYKNYAFLDIYEPGSTFKLVTTAAVIENKKKEIDSLFHCDGSIKIDSGGEIKCEHPHGEISLKQAVASSCNVAMVKASTQMDYKEFYDVTKKLGFGDKTGVNFPSEARGIMTSPEKFISKRDIASMGFGQGIAVTGIQMATAVSALVNGGIFKEPRIIKKLEKNGKTVKDFASDEEIRVVSEETSENIRNIMRASVEEGTGVKAAVPYYSVGGKTGTAQKAGVGGYMSGKFISSFIGAFPVDEPQYLIYVVIDEPRAGEYYGGTVAGPAFSSLARKIAEYKKLEPEIEVVPGENNIRHIMPNFSGLSRSVLHKRVQMLNAQVEIIGSGDFVVYQEPAPGNIIEEEDKVEIYFGDIKQSTEGNILPDFRGLTMRKALRIVGDLGINFEFQGSGRVESQEPSPGGEINENTQLILEFSK
ncbi:MAG: penicillin-binding transpeptidase domain-containing protein [Candidatus Muiribacteriota bacterium]